MAIQNIKCPNCSGEVHMDDSLERGFCMYCGSEIHIKEEVAKIKIEHSGKIEHTGKVEIDDSKKLANSIELANRAFDSGNYVECYTYCCTALECDTNNFHITFRKGLCAAYISFSRTNELKQSIKTAIEIINNTSKDGYNDVYIIFTELLKYIRSTFALNCNRSKNFTYPDYASANNTFSTIITLTNLCALCSDLISNEMMDKHPTFENDKKVCLEQGLTLCEMGVSSFKYFAGYKQVKKGDTFVQKEVYEYLKSPFYETQKNYYAKFKNDFNNLPTTKKALMEYNVEISKLQKDIDAFNQKLEGYFVANPEISKEYKKTATPLIILTGIAFMLISVVGTNLANTSSPIVFGVTMSILSLALVGLGVFTVIRLISYSKNRNRILSELPPELLALKNVHDQSKIKLQSVNQSKAAFERKNVKK